MSCQTQELYQTKDFTPQGSFTAEAEGPAVDKNGNLYAVSYDHKETVGKVKPSGEASIYFKMPQGSTANGIRFSSKGEMFLADYTGHNILRVDSQKRISVFAHNDKMNQPNDLAIMDNDILFASDPNWKEGTGQLWRCNTNGELTLLESKMGTTNGVEVSTDQKYLYVNESKQRNIWVYDLDKKGNVSNKKLFYHFKDGGLDGMRCDSDGNLYVTRWGSGQVVKLSPAGDLLETITLKGMKPTNIAFGGEDGKTCYVTVSDRGNIETFRVDSPGRSYVLKTR